MRLTPESFAKFWKLFVESVENTNSLWNSDNEWNINVIYKKEKNNHSLLKKIEKTFDGLKADFEYRKIDIVIYSIEKYKCINHYDNEGEENTNIPIGLEAIIEHENDYRKVFEEIRKLIEYRSRLKVLITYPKDINSEKAIRKKFIKCIKQANSFLPENDETKYLLITGYNNNNKISWNFFKSTKYTNWEFIKT